LVSEIAHLRELLEANTAELTKLNERLGQRDSRIVELERLLSESRRSGKRQAAPFSKGEPKEEPAKPGRRSGCEHLQAGQGPGWSSARPIWTVGGPADLHRSRY
jgi:uncharacterized protein involved in exopolysaccharide biosynthesis